MARLKHLEIRKHHVVRITDWVYSIVLVIYGSAWALEWARLALRGKAILVWACSRGGGYGPASRTMYPITMWFFALLGAFVVAVGIRNIRRLLANQSIG